MFVSPRSALEKQTISLMKNGLPIYRASLLAFFSGQTQLSLCLMMVTQTHPTSSFSQSHRTSYASWEFLHAMSAVIENHNITKVRNSRFMSLLIDELSDISLTKNLMLYFSTLVKILC